jgi:CheY-like chemotaxis protein
MVCLSLGAEEAGMSDTHQIAPRKAEARLGEPYVDTAVGWVVGVVCVCIVLQTLLLIVLATSVAFSHDASLQKERAAALATLTASLVTLKWPLVVFGVVVVLRIPLTAIVRETIARLFTSGAERSDLAAESLQWSGTTKDLTRIISGAYDQYEKPMTEDQRERLERYLRSAAETGEIESMRDLRILWLHKMAEHDRREADAFEQCGAEVEFVDSLEQAREKLAASAKPYDIVISHMGEAKDGFELYRTLPEEQQKHFIIYTRNAKNQEFIDDADDRGIERYTSLPWELFRLVLNEAKTLPPVSRRSAVAKKSAKPKDNGKVAAPSPDSEVVADLEPVPSGGIERAQDH